MNGLQHTMVDLKSSLNLLDFYKYAHTTLDEKTPIPISTWHIALKALPK